MSKEIILPESAEDYRDLFDGLIIEAYQNDSDFSNLDIHTLSSIYARLMYYLDILKYINSPLEDYKKYEEANKLSDKLGIEIDKSWFIYKVKECETLLQKK